LRVNLNERQRRKRLSEGKDEVLTAAEVASELRCSKAHVYNAINGKLVGVSPLPAIEMGRRKLIRRCAFEDWKKSNEARGFGAIIRPRQEIGAV